MHLMLMSLLLMRLLMVLLVHLLRVHLIMLLKRLHKALRRRRLPNLRERDFLGERLLLGMRLLLRRGLLLHEHLVLRRRLQPAHLCDERRIVDGRRRGRGRYLVVLHGLPSLELRLQPRHELLVLNHLLLVDALLFLQCGEHAIVVRVRAPLEHRLQVRLCDTCSRL